MTVYPVGDRQTFLHLPATVWTIDSHGKIQSVLGRADQQLSLDEQGWRTGSEFPSYPRIHRDDVDQVREAYHRLFVLNQPLDVEYRLRNQEGQWVWRQDRSSETYRVADGLFADGISIDVTRRKKQEFSTSVLVEQRFRHLAETIREVFWLCSTGWQEVNYVSPAFETLWGQSCDSLYQDPQLWFWGIHTGDRGAVQSVIDAWSVDTQPQIHLPEFRVIRPDGSWRWVYARCFAIHNRRGEVYRLAGVAEDITERKAAEQALQESRDLLNGIIQGTNDAVFLKDRNGRYEVINESGAKVFGLAVEEVLGKSDHDLLSPDDAHRCDEDDKRVFTTGAPTSQEITLNVPAGHRVFLVNKTPHFNVQGEVIGIIGDARDITEMKLTEERVRHTERLISMGTLAAGIAHEINNPLGLILLAAQQAAEEKDGPSRVKDSLKEIIDLTQRCGRIVKSVLKFARQETGERWPSNVNESVQNAVEITKSLTYSKKASVVVEYGEDLPLAVINPTEIEQVTANIITNAIEASDPHGTITVCTKRTPKEILISVKDNGRGLSDEDKRFAFDPFYSSRLKPGGTGLGLSIAHGIIADYGGSIDIDSEPGKGTTVNVLIPVES